MVSIDFSPLMLLVMQSEGHLAYKVLLWEFQWCK